MRITTAIKKLIDSEVRWCKDNYGKSGKHPQFEKGFIAGLKQSKALIRVTQNDKTLRLES